MDPQDTILVTGGSGMVGSAMVRYLKQLGFGNVLAPSRLELDLCQADAVDYYFRTNRPRYVMMFASKVGGILANFSDPVGFLDENVRIYTSVYAACHRYNVSRQFLCLSTARAAAHSRKCVVIRFARAGA